MILDHLDSRGLLDQLELLASVVSQETPVSRDHKERLVNQAFRDRTVLLAKLETLGRLGRSVRQVNKEILEPVAMLDLPGREVMMARQEHPEAKVPLVLRELLVPMVLLALLEKLAQLEAKVPLAQEG